MRHSSNNHKNKGFTALELLIVVGLTALIAGLSFASFNALNNRNLIDKEMDNIKSIIQKTRLESLNAKNSHTHGITFSSGSLNKTETGTTTAQAYTYTSGVTLVQNNLRQISNYSATSSVAFAQISGLANATGTLVYVFKVGSSQSATKTLTINALGIVE